MSIHNRYANVPLTEEDFTTFDTQFAIIEKIMGALQEPNGLILRRVAKLGLKSDTFTRDALMLAAQHEELLPRGLDVQQLEAQVRLRDELKSRALHMKLMARKMEKIVQLLGSDVFSGALAAYKSMKANHRGTLNEQLRELGRIFRNRKKGAGEDEAQQGKDEGPETRVESQRQHGTAVHPMEKGRLVKDSERESLAGADGTAALVDENSAGRAVQQMPLDPPCATQSAAPNRLEHEKDTPRRSRHQGDQRTHENESSPEEPCVTTVSRRKH